MASTYSPNLRLTLIATGEQQGQWGITTNTNLGTLLEEAIGGYISVAVTDGADTTLTTNNGSADQSRNMVINLTGALTAARNVICPAIEKMYVVKNATTGGFAVTFKVSGQTGVSIPNGSTYILYVNGTDAVLATGTIAAQNSNNVSITGGSITGITDLAIADGGTGASTAAGAATNLGLGTGDSPQFAAVNIGNATDTTITRVSAGVIAVEGKTVVTETGGQTVQFAAGSNTAPSITTTGDTNTGIYFPAADTIAFTEGGAEAMRIDSAGNVGIGTTTPSGYLTRVAAVAPSDYGASFVAVSNGSAANWARIDLKNTNVATNTYWYKDQAGIMGLVNEGAHAMYFGTNNTERMRIDSSGNVGIGTSSPGGDANTRAVTANGSTGAQFTAISGTVNSIYAAYSAYGALVGTTSNHILGFQTNNTERMRIDSSGNVGIGISGPANPTLSGYSGKLTIDGIGSYYNQSNNYLSPLSISTAGFVTNLALPLYAGGGSVRAICVAYNSDTLEFTRASNASATGGVTRDMVIDGSGNVGIGTTTFGTSAATVLAIATGTAPSTGPADTIQIFSTDLSAGNTILSLRTEGTPVNANTTAAATHRIAVRINGTVYYLLANTAA